MAEALLAAVAGYLLGSLAFAAWIARARGTTIFEVGSGNMGAMNTARNLGFAVGALVLVLDIAKGALATELGLLLGGGGPAVGALAAPLAAGLGAVLGHGFSLYLGFRGGKGLATALGVALPLYPVGGLLGALLLASLTLALRRRPGVAAVITVALYPGVVSAALLARGEPPSRTLSVAAGVAAIAVVVLFKHLLAYRRERRRGG